MQSTDFVELCVRALFIILLFGTLSASKLVKKCPLKHLHHGTKDDNYGKVQTPTKYFK